MAPEQLLFFALFILLALVNVLARWMRARAERRPRVEPRAPREVREAPPPRRAAPPRIMPTPAPALAPRVVQRVVRRRRSEALPLGGPRDLRRAIVLMTLLGPCRALERRGPPSE